MTFPSTSFESLSTSVLKVIGGQNLHVLCVYFINILNVNIRNVFVNIRDILSELGDKINNCNIELHKSSRKHMFSAMQEPDLEAASSVKQINVCEFHYTPP